MSPHCTKLPASGSSKLGLTLNRRFGSHHFRPANFPHARRRGPGCRSVGASPASAHTLGRLLAARRDIEVTRSRAFNWLTVTGTPQERCGRRQSNVGDIARGPHLADRRRHLAMGQGPHVPHHGVLRAEDRPDTVAGVSVLSSIATAHSSTVRMRCRTTRAVRAFTCQIGARISNTSPLVTSETGLRPMRGKA